MTALAATLRERQQEEAEARARQEAALKGSKHRLQDARRASRHKKKPAEELLGYLEYTALQPHQIRDVAAYRPRSYNLDRQIADLIGHLFVRYPVPGFLYQACIDARKREGAAPEDPFGYMHDLYRDWFVTLAQGGSFPRAVKGVMTAKEAFEFLSGGDPNRLVHENVWLAKMKVAGVPRGLHGLLLERILASRYFDDPGGRLAELIRFYARCHAEMGGRTLLEVTDFLAWKLGNDRAFSLKGRTAGSVVKLANEWHLLIQKARLGANVEWDGFDRPYWSLRDGRLLWEVVELRNNQELMNEGRKQKHCVYSYVDWCAAGRCSIFSLRLWGLTVAGVDEAGNPAWGKSDERARVTVEVTADRSIAQVRGPLNRPATPEERAVLGQWAGANGFIFRSLRW